MQSKINTTPAVPAAINNDKLQLCLIKLKPDYAKKWNCSDNDNFMLLTYNGVLLRDTLYRVGGMTNPKQIGVDRYSLILKYVEDVYDDNITKDPQRKRHLQGIWCIIDQMGNEKKVFTPLLSNAYLIKDSCIYTLDKKYYNIETGYCYTDGSVYNQVESDSFIFLENEFGKDPEMRGVIKIAKKDGSWELIK